VSLRLVETNAPPSPQHDHYKIEAQMIGDEGDMIVFGTHDEALARDLARQHLHTLTCLGVRLEKAPHLVHDYGDCSVAHLEARVGWWRQRPAQPDEDYQWWLVKADGPGRGARPGVYFSA
jgi:hypothetical protein